VPGGIGLVCLEA
jgi:hypothetical protein